MVIVDDNDMTRTLLRGILRQSDYQVLGEAKDGEAALSLLQKVQPEVVCLDVVMPHGDGLTALERIRAAHPAVKVLMITASSDRDTVRAAIDKGAHGYVVKPFNAARVIEALERALKSA